MISKDKHYEVLRERKAIESCNDAYNFSCNQSIFPIIRSSNELISFLKRVSKEHNDFFHYTNIDGLACMIKTRRWKFSSARKTNDLHEFSSKGSPDEWRYIYSCSLSHGDEDNIGMWKMYGDKKYSICLRLSPLIIKTWIDSLERTKEYYCNTKDYKALTPNFQELSFHDIAYIHGYQSPYNSVVCWGNIINSAKWISNISNEKDLTGFIKNSAWEYEKETRIMIRLPKVSNIYDTKFYTPDEIYVDLYDEMINDIEEIIISPFALRKNDLLDRLHVLLGSPRDYNRLKEKFNESYFAGKIQGSNLA